MKQKWNSFLQSVIQFVNSMFVNVSKEMQRSAVLMTAGISVVTVLTLTAGDLQGGGRNALVAFAETPEHTEGAETELEEADSDESATDEEHSDQTETEAETAAKETAGDGTEEAVDAENTDGTESTEPEAEEVPASDGNGSTGESLNEDAENGPGYESEPEEESEDLDTDKVIELSDKEYNVLLRIVQAEAGGCDEMGRILVANVILNRVESDEFPDTVSGVVYQECQFSPVSNGSINTCKVTGKTIDAVNRALEGEDYSEGALYFMNRSKSSSKNVNWFDTKLDYLFKHGDHEFFR